MLERLNLKGGEIYIELVEPPASPKAGEATRVAGGKEEAPVKELRGQKRIMPEPSGQTAASLNLAMATQETIV